MRISMNDVAKAANVSQSAVSRVLNGSGYVSEDKRERILAAIRDMGYRPNALARSLVKSKSHTIGLCVPYLNTPFISSLMEGVEEESEKYGYDVFMCHTKEDPEVEEKAISRMLDRQVDGMIIVPVLGDKHCIKDIINIVPTMVLLRKPEGVDRNLIYSADYQAARQSFSLLLDRGHTNIGILTGPPVVSTINERLKGVMDLLKERGVKIDPSLIVRAPFDYQKCHKAVQKIFSSKKKVTALYPFHYWALAAVQRTIFEKRLRVPEDISVSAFESFEDWNFMQLMKVATNIFPARQMGGAAVAKVHDLIVNRELFLEENIIIKQDFYPFDSVKDLNA